VDNVTGSDGTVYLSNAQANVSGGGDTVDFLSGSGNATSLSGTDYSTVFNQPTFGLDNVNGYNSTDTLSFSIADQGLLSVSQSGANTLITLDANDIVDQRAGVEPGLDHLSHVRESEPLRFGFV
jgi:hypothetical protein